MSITPDISIPEFEIADGWYVSDLETQQDCRDAKDILDAAIIAIKEQRDRYDAGLSPDRDPDWRIRVDTALRYKSIIHTRVHQKLGELTGLRDLYRAHDDLKQRMARIRKVVATSPDETLRADIEVLVDRRSI